MDNNQRQIREVLETAIGFEIGAQRLYKAMGAAAGDPDSKTTLIGLSKEEARHEKLLRDLYVKRFERDAEVAEPSYRQGDEVKTGLGIVETLELAMSRERAAVEYYGGKAAETTEADVRDLLLLLEREEKGHLELLQWERKSRAGQPWDPLEMDNWVRDA